MKSTLNGFKKAKYMYAPKYLIRLSPDKFKLTYAGCLCEQLRELLESAHQLLPPHHWYGADIDVDYYEKDFIKHRDFLIRKIGNSLALTEGILPERQFLSGVFMAISEGVSDDKIEAIEVGTEDDMFRSLDLDDVLLEIRAFDTSYFEVYSEEKELINALSNRFKGCEIIEKMSD